MKKIMLVAAAAVLALSLVGCSKGGASAKGKKDALNISIFTIQQREQQTADNKKRKPIPKCRYSNILEYLSFFIFKNS